MPAETLLAIAITTLVAASLHSAVGFGSGPLLVPVLLLGVDPATAVVAAVAVGMEVNLLQLAAERRRPTIATRRLLPVWLAAPPGAVAGARPVLIRPSATARGRRGARGAGRRASRTAGGCRGDSAPPPSARACSPRRPSGAWSPSRGPWRDPILRRCSRRR
jgi:hypothetical protein